MTSASLMGNNGAIIVPARFGTQFSIRTNATIPLNQSEKQPRRVLSLFDCVCIIVGTIIGAGIFKMPAPVAANVPNVYWLAAVWTFGGLVALIGALCFAELTTCYPDRGGDYGYLKRGYHRRLAFAFSWAAFWIIRPGNIGTMAMIFGEFKLPTDLRGEAQIIADNVAARL